MPKTITDAQLVGARGEALVNARANAMGFMFSRYGPLEAGIDGLLELRDPQNFAATGRLVAVQIKTKSQGSYTAENESNFDYLMEENDIEYWRECSLPVIMVLVHLEREAIYWKPVDSGEGPGKRRLHVDKTRDKFDKESRERIAGLCAEKSGFGVWFPPLNSGENGFLNLLNIILPGDIYVAPSSVGNGRLARSELLKRDDRPPDDWVIYERRFMSFRDPRDNCLSRIVDLGAVEKISAEEVMFPEQEAEEHAVINLLRRTLVAQFDGVLAYNHTRRVLYFPAAIRAINRTYRYHALKQQTSAMVVKKYQKDGK